MGYSLMEPEENTVYEKYLSKNFEVKGMVVLKRCQALQAQPD